jgi:hypothetical protein
MVSIILLVFGFVCCVVYAFWQPNPAPRANLFALGVAFYLLSLILSGVFTGAGGYGFHR